MKNIFKLLGIIALAAIIGFSFTACGGGGDDDGGGNDDPKVIKITGFSDASWGSGKTLQVNVRDNNTNNVAYGFVNYTTGTDFTFELKKKEPPYDVWKGSGNFRIELELGTTSNGFEEDYTWYYSNGKNAAQLGIDASESLENFRKLPTIKIEGTASNPTKIAFSKFAIGFSN